MKNISQILNLLLATALVVFAIKITLIDKDKECQGLRGATTEQSSEAAAIENIMTRNSVRKYTTEKVSNEDVEVLLRAAMAAPTAGNRQPWEFVVVDNPDILKQFPPIVKGAHMAKNAPLAIVACGVPSKSIPAFPTYWIQDVSAATENLLLAAHAKGLGAVWCGVFPDEKKVEGISKVLSLPKELVPLAIVVVGHPSGTTHVKDKWKPEKVSYNKYGEEYK